MFTGIVYPNNIISNRPLEILGVNIIIINIILFGSSINWYFVRLQTPFAILPIICNILTKIMTDGFINVAQLSSCIVILLVTCVISNIHHNLPFIV